MEFFQKESEDHSQKFSYSDETSEFESDSDSESKSVISKDTLNNLMPLLLAQLKIEAAKQSAVDTPACPPACLPRRQQWLPLPSILHYYSPIMLTKARNSQKKYL